MSDEQEKKQILTQQPETIASFDAPSEAAETPLAATTEDDSSANYETETPLEIATTEDDLTANYELA
ncbi:MAG TPA: hypothetical protein DCS91_23315, partial [Microcoleaceae bacterium UBA11344]|nr:hypothetical protein [Microcoleaceae cyanobacterium UBA11344]